MFFRDAYSVKSLFRYFLTSDGDDPDPELVRGVIEGQAATAYLSSVRVIKSEDTTVPFSDDLDEHKENRVNLGLGFNLGGHEKLYLLK